MTRKKGTTESGTPEIRNPRNQESHCIAGHEVHSVMEGWLPKVHTGASLEGKVDDLAVLLSAGLTDEFVRQFKRIAQDSSDDRMDMLVEMVNERLRTNSRRRQLRLVVSQKNDVMVLDGSRFFGNSFSIARETFAV